MWLIILYNRDITATEVNDFDPYRDTKQTSKDKL